MPESEGKRYRFDEEEPSRIDVDFDALLRKLDELYEKVLGMSGGDISSLLAETRALLSEKVGNHTKDKNEIDVGIENEMHPLLKRIFDLSVEKYPNSGNFRVIPKVMRLVSEKETQLMESEGYFKGTGLQGGYVAEKGVIVYNHDTADMRPSKLIASLASSGEDYTLKMFHHEYIHSRQYDEPGIEASKANKKRERANLQRALNTFAMFCTMAIMAYSGTPEAAQLLPVAGYGAKQLYDNHKRKIEQEEDLLRREAHAFIGSGYYRGTKFLLENLQIEYNFAKNPEMIDHLLAADNEIKRLYALGLSDEEIGTLVKTAKWDQKQIGYDALEDKFTQLLEKTGLEAEDVDNLVLADDLRSEIYSMDMQIIAREELVKFHDQLLQHADAAQV
jgi:hypothetical protein